MKVDARWDEIISTVNLQTGLLSSVDVACLSTKIHNWI